MKLLVLNQATRHPDFALADAATKMTWIHSGSNPNVKVLSYYGNLDIDGNMFPFWHRRGCYEKYDELICECIDFTWKNSRDMRLAKFVNALEWALNNEDFDYVYRTGVPCYYDTDLLYEFLLNLPRFGVYGGQAHRRDGDSFKFTAGFNTLLSRDVVEKIVENKHRIEEVNELVEDIALGKLITELCNIVKSEDITRVVRYRCFRELNNKGHDISKGDKDIPEGGIWAYRFSFYYPKRIIKFHDRYLEFKKQNR